MRILLVASAYNSMTQRVHAELADRGHEVSVELALHPSPPLLRPARRHRRLDMDTGMMFLDCPAYTDDEATARCGLPAAVEYLYAVSSTDGPLESARIRCPRGHFFNGPIEALTWEKHPGRLVGQPA